MGVLPICRLAFNYRAGPVDEAVFQKVKVRIAEETETLRNAAVYRGNDPLPMGIRPFARMVFNSRNRILEPVLLDRDSTCVLQGLREVDACLAALEQIRIPEAVVEQEDGVEDNAISPASVRT